MKKYLSILFLIAFIVPSIVFASWWNPFSWFNNWTFHKTEIAPQVQVDTKTPEEKINELQKQLDELKNQQLDSTSTTTPVLEDKKIVPKTDNLTKVVKPAQVVDVCLNITGTQTQTPQGYSWSYGNICSVINLTDYCPNINGIQSKVPDGMFIYGSSKECLTQNEINYISDKMTEAKLLEEICGDDISLGFHKVLDLEQQGIDHGIGLYQHLLQRVFDSYLSNGDIHDEIMYCLLNKNYNK